MTQRRTFILQLVPATLAMGAALRAINRQSADLLETAETVSSLKLQAGASAAAPACAR